MNGVDVVHAHAATVTSTFPEMICNNRVELFGVEAERCERIIETTFTSTQTCPVCTSQFASDVFAIAITGFAGDIGTQISCGLGLGSSCLQMMTTELAFQMPYFILDFVAREVALSTVPHELAIYDRAHFVHYT